MFDQLFVRPSALGRQTSGPMAAERQAYVAYLAEQGMGRRTLREAARYILRAAESLQLSDRLGEMISRAEIDQQALCEGPEPTAGASAVWTRQHYRFRQYATGWLRFLGRLEALPTTPHPYARKIASFLEYLHRERGLARTTIAHYRWNISHFLLHLHRSGVQLRYVTIEHIEAAIVQRATGRSYARSTMSDYAGNLRNFFRYAEHHGWCRPGLPAGIIAPRHFTQKTIPHGPSWDEVRELLRMTEGDRPDDIRDRALLLLLVVYGLRAGEVVELRLEDIEWERELLTIADSKSQQPRIYPLTAPVGAALTRYLKEVRPHSAIREIFLSRQAPLRPLHRCSLYVIVARRLRGVSPKLPRFGPHALRHACATHLLERGLSLKEIGDHLGHRHPDTTRIYTKVNLAQLRKVGELDLGGVL